MRMIDMIMVYNHFLSNEKSYSFLIIQNKTSFVERYNGGSAQYNNGGGQYSNGGGQYNNAIERKPRGKPAPKRLYKYNTTTGFNVHMRGLPYQATDQDICDVSILGGLLVLRK